MLSCLCPQVERKSMASSSSQKLFTSTLQTPCQHLSILTRLRALPFVSVSAAWIFSISASGSIALNLPPSCVSQIQYCLLVKRKAGTSSIENVVKGTTTTCPSPRIVVVEYVSERTPFTSCSIWDCIFPVLCLKRSYTDGGKTKITSMSRGGLIAVNLPHDPASMLFAYSELEL